MTPAKWKRDIKRKKRKNGKKKTYPAEWDSFMCTAGYIRKINCRSVLFSKSHQNQCARKGCNVVFLMMVKHRMKRSVGGRSRNENHTFSDAVTINNKKKWNRYKTVFHNHIAWSKQEKNKLTQIFIQEILQNCILEISRLYSASTYCIRR